MNTYAAYDTVLETSIIPSVSERYDPLMDAPVAMKNGSSMSSMLLADRSFQHELYGKQLAKQLPRFSFQFPDNKNIIKNIGPDADTNGHMYELAYHVANFLRENNVLLSNEDRGILMFAVMIHDNDETMHRQINYACGGVVGDRKAGAKTEVDRRNQKAIRQYQYRDIFSDVSSSIITQVEDIISGDDETLLGAIYRYAHEVQSLETTYIAEQTLVDDAYENKEKDGLITMSSEVRASILNKLNTRTRKLGEFGVKNVQHSYLQKQVRAA